MSNDKADGWVAWHPKLGVDVYNGENIEGWRYSYTEVYRNAYQVEKYADPFRIKQEGWRARPVKLQFLDEPQPGDLKEFAHPIKLVQTCGACPEQYDAFWGEKQVGYLRLRHGSFTVDCPECGGETVYSDSPRGDGRFEEHERTHFLEIAKNKIYAWVLLTQNKKTKDLK